MMPFEITLAPTGTVVRIRVWGDVTLEELAQMREQLIGEPSFRSDSAILVDLRNVTQLLDSGTLRSLAERFLTNPLGTGKRALVSDVHAVYGLLRMLTTLTEKA